MNQLINTVKQNAPSSAIARLNDQFRANWDNPSYGTTILTQGVQALLKGRDDLQILMLFVAEDDSFNEDNNPYGERDFGVITYHNETLFWKIGYYNLAMTEHSENAANPHITHRVLTVMLVQEY